MSDDDIEVQMAKVHQEVATHNSKLAVKFSEKTQKDTHAECERLTAAVNTLSQKVLELDRKYNLLLSERFNTGSTVHGD